MPKYVVYIDDNYHPGDTIKDQEFDSEEAAIEACKKIALASLKHMYEEGMDADKLIAQWTLFGEDPFVKIEPHEDREIRFSARTFINTELANEIINELRKSS